MEDQINGRGMIIYPKPVTHIFPFTIYRQWLIVFDVVNH